MTMHYAARARRLLSAAALSLLFSAALRAEVPNSQPSVIVFVTSISDLATDRDLLETFQSRWRQREPFADIMAFPLAPYAYTMTPEAKSASIAAITERLCGKRPTLIVAQGDPAFFLSVDLRKERFPGAPIIAFDVVGNADRKRQFAGEKAMHVVDVFGIGEKNLEFGARVFPKRKRAVVLLFVGPEVAQVDELRRTFAAAGPGLDLVFVVNPMTQEAADPYLRIAPDDTFVVDLNPGWVDSSGRYLSGKYFVRSIQDAYDVPVIDYMRSDLDGGSVGGVGLSPTRWGIEAADMAMGLVFDGVEPDQWMPGSRFVTPFADYREVVRFGSSPAYLPSDTELINRPPSAWLRYQAYLQPLLALLGVFVVYLALRAFFKRREEGLLVAANARLEGEVAQRTRELQTSNEELSAANSNLSDAMRRTEEMQDAVLRSAREIALGRFAAGMANGLNSPLGAARASNAAMRAIARDGEGGYPGSLISFDEAQRALFMRCAKRVLSRSDYLAGGPVADSGELSRRLALLGGEDAHDVADDLAEAGLEGLSDDELREFAGEKGRAVARALYRLYVLDSSTWIIDEAVDRAAETIKAVVDYAGEGGAGETPSDVDLRDSIERALLIFKGRLPRSVVLRTEFEDLPPVRGSAAGLARVWVSLIQNALQAMPDGGRLDISLRRDGRFAVASVEDEGVGIDPAIEDRIFEPFVTTRPMAEGMGLGLALCKRAVEAAGGEIGYFRRERGTAFRVRLPLAEG
jgi:signal transduction histidine kinase